MGMIVCSGYSKEDIKRQSVAHAESEWNEDKGRGLKKRRKNEGKMEEDKARKPWMSD